MQVSSINDVRIYNLSSGKSIPEWMNTEARRRLERRSIDVRRRVQLIQDFEMPDVSHTVNVSQDGRYVFATGCYKSWLKCYDLENLSLKFQRGLDAAVIKLISLGDDYSKIILLEEDRFLEMHAAFGRYFRMRMPRFGRDMAYSFERSDLHLVGASSEVYRLNLELGEWLSPLQTNGSALNCCKFAQPHQLFVCGTTDGQLEAWDHRDRLRVGVLDCMPYLQETSGKVEITSLNFRDALCLGVGTSSGHVMLYDIRSRKPLMVKDHINGLPIKRIDFASRGCEDLVLSMDSRILKIWNAVEGKPFAAIETDCALNDFCRYFDSGLIFFANEGSRLQQFFIPALGTAPKWCYYLETITEELEESQSASLYDDYKFVTKEELDKLGLSNLIGTSVLRAYMHGYFLDRRLYDKAQLMNQPDAYEKYVNKKIHDLVHQERERKVINHQAEMQQPKVNKELASRLRAEAASEGSVRNLNKKKKNGKLKAISASAILEDGRFKKLFDNQDFEIDQHCDQFKRNALLKQKESSVNVSVPLHEEDLGEENEVEEMSGLSLTDTSEYISHRGQHMAINSSDSELDETLNEKIKLQRDKLRQKAESFKRHRQLFEEKMMIRETELAARLVNRPKKFVLHEFDSTESAQEFLNQHTKEVDGSENSSTLAARKLVMQQRSEFEKHEDVLGGRSMTFNLAKKGASAREFKEVEDRKKHAKERRTTVRVPTSNIKRSLKRLPGKLSRL